MRTVLAATLVAVAALSLSPLRPVAARERPRDAALAPITSLAFLEGTWRGTFDGERFEASYSSPSGGKLVGWSKGFTGQRATFVELEVFEEREGSLVVTPSPGGRRAETFTLVALGGERAEFANEKGMVRRLVYERVAPDRLRLVASGERGGESFEWVFDLSRDERAPGGRSASR